MNTIKLASGVSVRPFKLPPRGFKAVEAEPRELLLYGFPARPSDNPRMLARWTTAVGRAIRPIQPTFRAVPYKTRRLPQIRAGTIHGTESSDIWSGVLVQPPAGDSFRWVEGTFTVPNSTPPSNAQDGVWYSASTWVGIDGANGSGDVLQAGCDADAMTQNGNVQHQLNPWWEWYPAGSYWITNFLISPGDTVNCLVCADSTTQATIYFYNLTTGLATSFQATPPQGTSLQGNCAEWVVERLTIDTNTPQLARYGEVYFAEAIAGTENKATAEAGSGSIIQMVDNGSVISTGDVIGPEVVRVRYTGS